MNKLAHSSRSNARCPAASTAPGSNVKVNRPPRLLQSIQLAGLLLLGGPLGHGADLLKWDLPANSNASSSGNLPISAPGISGTVITANTSPTGTTSSGITAESTNWCRTGFDMTTFDDALTAGDYYSFETTAAIGYEVTFSGAGSSIMRTGSTGPKTVGLFYSTDNTSFALIASSPVNSTADTDIGAAFDVALAANPIHLSAGATGYWRVVAYDATTATAGGRLRWRANFVSGNDFSLTGTATAQGVIRNLLWTGAGGNDWNTSPSNTNWADTGASNAPAAFATNDNVTIDIPAAISVDGGGITAGTIAVANGSGSVAITGGALTGSSLAKVNAGTLSLGGTNSFPGGVSVTGGILELQSDNALGIHPVAVDGALLRISASATVIANPLGLGASGMTLETDASVAFSGNVTANAAGFSLVKTGPGELTLSGGLGFQNTAPVDFDLSAGSAVFTGTGASKQKNLSGTNTLDGELTLDGTVLMLHGSTVAGTGSITITDATSSITSRLNLGAVHVGVPVAMTTDLNVESPSGNNLLFLDGALSGDGALVKKGNGIVQLSAANTYAGTTTVDAGSLRLGLAGILGAGDVTLNVTTTTGTLILDRDDTYTIPNKIAGAGNVSMTGGTAAVATLSGANIYLGTTTISGGTLATPLIADSSNPSGIGASGGDGANLVLNGGTLAHTGPAASTDRDFTLGINGGGIAANGTGPLTFSSTGSVTLTEPAESPVGNLTTGTTYKIVTTGDTDFTLIGAPDSNPGTTFTATGPGTGTGTVVFANPRGLRLAGTAPGTSVFAPSLANAENARCGLSKSGSNTWSLAGAHTYTGATNVNEGTLRIDGDSSAATGNVNVAAGAFLGGNGSTGGTVVLAANAGLAARISNWAGAPGSGYDDLAAAAVNAGSNPFTVTVDTTGLANFTEGPKSFTILTTTGGVTGLSPANVTVTAPGFPGAGYWSIAQSGNALVLNYTLTPPDPYLAWVAPFNLTDPAKGADPDGDGIENLLEFVLDGNPGASDPGILPDPPTLTTDHFEISFSRREDSKTTVNQTVQYGTTLAAWTDIAIPDAAGTHTVGVATVIVDDGTPASAPDTVIVRIPRTAAAAGRLFARLVASE